MTRRIKPSIAFLLLCAAPPLCADWALKPDAGEKPVQQVEYALTLTGNAGLEQNRAFGSLGYRFAYGAYEAAAGFQSGGDVNDLTLSFACWGVKSVHQWRTWEFGLESIYHYQHYEDVYGEHDALFYFNIRQRRDNGFELVLKQGATFKAANIYAAGELVTNWNPSAFLQVGKTWQNGCELYTSVASHDTWRYPLFFAPRFIVGTACTLGGFFRPCVEFEFGMTDFFATSAYFNVVELRLSGRITL